MTNEQKLAAVEDALDGGKLVAEARDAFQESLECRWFYFETGQCDTHAWKWEKSGVETLSQLGLDDKAIGTIWAEEEARFNAYTQQNIDPEIWQVWESGTPEEEESFQRAMLAGTLDEWIEDRKHQKRRGEYAQKFYGVIP